MGKCLVSCFLTHGVVYSFWLTQHDRFSRLAEFTGASNRQKHTDHPTSRRLYIAIVALYAVHATLHYVQKLIDSARIVSAAGSMKRLSVRPSVRLSHQSTAAAACGGFAAKHPAGRRYRSIAGAGAQQQRRRSTAISRKCVQCRVDSRGTRLNTDLSRNKTEDCVGCMSYLPTVGDPESLEGEQRRHRQQDEAASGRAAATSPRHDAPASAATSRPRRRLPEPRRRPLPDVRRRRSGPVAGEGRRHRRQIARLQFVQNETVPVQSVAHKSTALQEFTRRVTVT